MVEVLIILKEGQPGCECVDVADEDNNERGL